MDERKIWCDDGTIMTDLHDMAFGSDLSNEVHPDGIFVQPP